MSSVQEKSEPQRYPELSIEEMDIQLDGDVVAYTKIVDFLKLLGYSDDQIGGMLFRGCERSDIDDDKGFVHERLDNTRPNAIWAFTGKEFLHSAQRDTFSSGETDSPLFYALKGTEEPAVVVLDSHKLSQLAEEPYQYVPVEGSTLEDSVVAVVSITH